MASKTQSKNPEMPKQKSLDESIQLSLRITRSATPLLLERLTKNLKDGESQSLVLRRLAEEALLLREHPIISALQLVDSKELLGQVFISNRGLAINTEEKHLYPNSTDYKSFSNETRRPDADMDTEAPAQNVAKAMSGGAMVASMLLQKERAR